MLKLSKLTDYAVVVLVRLSEEGGLQTSGGIAAATGIPEPTVAKVLKIMTSAGLVCSQRGARGGYRLARPLTQIPVADVITAIDGPIALTACVEHSPNVCESSGLCPVKGRWDTVNTAILDALSAISLADMHPVSFFQPQDHLAAKGPSGPGQSISTTAFVE
ncbi:MAG TPA: SUF system Fe-S cluster assembly regulator [Acidisoma sp.]|uniref:SUF system Fe-S cluster assembly regulator n=1 Tax=Acidisoma sp. TaxID=1872115 RepID=UPI002BFF13B0|nr:SUF system Fe-S cluster assembly regulator [Acidisoma sp.]HTI01250.1 SUF system Fe-S cluster assembly regulator [Acidisoma sp.]